MRTMSLRSVNTLKCYVAAKKISSSIYQFHMGRINTLAVMTKMVNIKVLGDVANIKLISNPMSISRTPYTIIALHGKGAISTNPYMSLPYPTSIGFGEFLFKTVKNRLRNWPLFIHKRIISYSESLVNTYLGKYLMEAVKKAVYGDV